jgi:hypothetical protein
VSDSCPLWAAFSPLEPITHIEKPKIHPRTPWAFHPMIPIPNGMSTFHWHPTGWYRKQMGLRRQRIAPFRVIFDFRVDMGLFCLNMV